ncbi:MAG: hypothetical protein CMC82_01640 [Flavobacteriaceae bacterium]|nr:hypothetical protein [Flavobacteriaceae bacterium]
MPQANVNQFTGHDFTTSETAIKFRSRNSGNPLDFNDVDSNFEILRKAINGLVADIGLASTSSSSEFDSLNTSINTLRSDTTQSLTDQATTIAGDITDLDTKVSNVLGTHPGGMLFRDAVNNVNLTVWESLESNRALIVQTASDAETARNQIISDLGVTTNADGGTDLGDAINGVPSISLNLGTSNETHIRAPLRIVSALADGTFGSLTTKGIFLTDHVDGGAGRGSSLLYNDDANGNEALVIDPLGTRKVEIKRGAKVDGNLNVTGNFYGIGGLSNPISNNLVTDYASTNGSSNVELTFTGNSSTGANGSFPPQATWAIFVIRHVGGAYPRFRVYASSTNNFGTANTLAGAGGGALFNESMNLVFENVSDKNSGISAQFLCPIIDGTCRLIITGANGANTWGLYSMGWL